MSVDKERLVMAHNALFEQFVRYRDLNYFMAAKAIAAKIISYEKLNGGFTYISELEKMYGWDK